MILRRATMSDLPTLTAWDREAHVISASGADDSFDWAGEIPRGVPWREILIGATEGRPVGVVVIIDPATEESHYWGDIEPGLRAIDIWIGRADDLGRGHGTAMMRFAIDRCFADPAVTAVLIDPLVANVRAHRFYERLGFVRIDRRMFGEDDCFVYRLERGLGTTACGVRRA